MFKEVYIISRRIKTDYIHVYVRHNITLPVTYITSDNEKFLIFGFTFLEMNFLSNSVFWIVNMENC